jgi:septal ring factor EnvC (AmiA/AmiB activator)
MRLTRWFLLVLCLPVLAAVSPGAAQEVEEREILESERRVEAIRAERERLEVEMGRLQGRVRDLGTELSNLEQQVGRSAGLVDELDYQLSQREAQIARTTYDLLMTRDQLAERRAVLHRRMRDIYKRGPLPTLRVLLAAESFSDLLNRYKYLQVIARYDRRLADEVATLERQLVARERGLRSNLTRIEAVRLERAAEARQMAAIRAERNTFAAGVAGRVAPAAVEPERQDLSDLIASLERRGTGGELLGARELGPVPGPGDRSTPTLGPARMGTLDWPLDGRVLFGFGRITTPDGTSRRSWGVGLTGPRGAAVRAVEAGRVAMAGPIDGYGRGIILDHGGGYFTVYLNVVDPAALEGGWIERGQRIGSVGEAVRPDGPHIEFQLRVPGGQAVDPLGWLIGR